MLDVTARSRASLARSAASARCRSVMSMLDTDDPMDFTLAPDGRDDLVEMALLAVHLIDHFTLHHLAGKGAAIVGLASEPARSPAH